MDVERAYAAPASGQELGRTLDAVRNEVYLACNEGRFHANVALESDSEWHAKNQATVVSALNRSGFSAEYRNERTLRVEWGHALLRASHTAEQLRPAGNVGVEDAAHSSLCRKVPRPIRASKYYDATLTVLSPEAVLERARVAAQAQVAQPTPGATAVQRAVAKLTQGETSLKLSRLSSAARDVETESSLSILQNEIEAQRNVDDSRHSIDDLLGEINSSAKSGGSNPLAALELELAKGPTDRRLREVEALIEEVDMAATPNTRRKNQQTRKNMLAAKAAQGAARAAEEPQSGRLELSKEVTARTSRAQAQADETFEKEARRLAKAEENKVSDESRVEAERSALIKAAEEAERLAEESTRSVASNSNASIVDSPAPELPEAIDARAERAAAERRDRELKEAALAEERRNLAELKAAQMEALQRQRDLEEREAAELHAELELKERERVRAEEERHAKEREAQAEQLKRQEEQLQAEQRESLAKIEAAKKAQIAEAQRQKEAVEQMQKQAATVASVRSVPEDIAFTPIKSGGGGVSALDTPATLQIKEDLNIEAMLGQLDFDLDGPRDAKHPAPVVNKNLQAANVSTMSRDSTARELEGLDNLMAGMDAFSFDTSVAATPVKTEASKALNDSRTGGLNIRDPVKTEDLDVEAALGSVDFDRLTGATTATAHKPMQHEFSTVVAHDTAKEVVQAAKERPAAPAPAPAPGHSAASGNANAFDDFKLDTIDVTGTLISASQLNVDVNLEAIGASPAKVAEEEKNAAALKAKAAEERKAADEKRAEVEKKAEAEKTAEVIQDDKSKAGFGDKKALFDKPAAKPAPAPAANGNKKKKNNKKNKGKK